MNKPEPMTAVDRGNRIYYVSDERLRAFGQLTPLQRLQWVEQCSHFVRLGQTALQADKSVSQTRQYRHIEQNEKHMPAKPPLSTTQSTAQLQALGTQLRARRKALRVSSTAAAEAAGMSRVTLHRIEKGEPSVAVGAWANAMAALGMSLVAFNAEDAQNAGTGGASRVDLTDWIPVRVRLADYPQLKALVWQVHGTDTLTPMEALGIYERNARHLDTAAMSPAEQALLQALRTGLGQGLGDAAAMGTLDV